MSGELCTLTTMAKNPLLYHDLPWEFPIYFVNVEFTLNGSSLEEIYVYVLNPRGHAYTIEHLFKNGYHRILDQECDDLLSFVIQGWDWHSHDSSEEYQMKYFTPVSDVLMELAIFLVQFSKSVRGYVGNHLIDPKGLIRYEITFPEAYLRTVSVSTAAEPSEIVRRLQYDVWKRFE